jgi:DNA-directed RNA polymerase sigma subunit (sigma70/sigma32)
MSDWKISEKEEVKRILASLTEREARVLRERFDAAAPGSSLEQIAEQFERIRARIREIEAKLNRTPPDGPPDGVA